MSYTTKFRVLFAALFTVSVIVALVGWMLDKDPTQLTGLIGMCVGAIGFGEASNVGKRATFKVEAMEAPDGE